MHRVVEECGEEWLSLIVLLLHEGDRLVGQPFSAPGYLWGRPSATAPRPYDAAASGGSNLGPLNPVLHEAVRARIAALRAADPAARGPVPVDLVTASGSGLDPHLSPAAAEYQVAVARGAYFPSIDLDAYGYLDRTNYSEFQEKTDWSAQIDFTFPVFDGGRIKSDLLTAKSRLQQAILDRDQLARQVELEVETAYLTVRSDEAQLKTLEVSVASADCAVGSEPSRAASSSWNSSPLSAASRRRRVTSSSAGSSPSAK